MLERNILYLLIFLIPVQLGRHFFFNFSSVAGVFSDYLTPTLYLTDLIILFLIFSDVKKNNKKYAGGVSKGLNISRGIYIFLGYCLFSCLIISSVKTVALYKFIKIVEFFWLFKIIVNLRLNLSSVVSSYSLAIIYSSILAIYQFLLQRSVGGWWWSLGERTFYASTPGIALGRLGNVIFLRPYATFAHPNILGGFLALGLPLVFRQLRSNEETDKRKRIIYIAAIILGTIALVVSFSRAAWAVFVFGMALTILIQDKNIRGIFTDKKSWYFWIFILMFILSIILPLNLASRMRLSRGSLYERKELILASLTTVFQNPVFGTGLNNSIIRQYQIIPKKYGTFIFQPVHNTYLLIFAELGIAGFLFLLIFLYKTFVRVNRNDIRQYIPFFMVLILGFFDHYIFSLQQGMLISVLFTSLVYWRQR